MPARVQPRVAQPTNHAARRGSPGRPRPSPGLGRHIAGCIISGTGNAGLDARRHGAGPWPLPIVLARYYLYSFQDIPAGPSIFQSIFQHILEYMDTDSPSRGRRSSKIAKNLTKSQKNPSETVRTCIASTDVLQLCASDSIRAVWKGDSIETRLQRKILLRD